MGDNSPNVTHRLKLYLEEKRLNVYAFETSIGVAKGVIQRPIKNGSGFNVFVLEKVGDKYHDLNMNWLLTGKGEMIANEENTSRNESPSDLQKQLIQAQQDLINCMKQNAELKESSAGIRRTSPA